MSVSGGDPTTVIDIDGPVERPVASPDGSRVVFSGFLNPPAEQSHTQSLTLWEGGKALPPTSGQQDFEIGSLVAGDQHRIERLQHIVGWFDKSLNGAATEAYDLK